MGWGRFFLLGDIGQQLDIQDRQRDMDRMRNQIDAQGSRDQTQDEQIAELREENNELKLYLAGLVKLMVRKGIVYEAEVEELVHLVDHPRAA